MQLETDRSAGANPASEFEALAERTLARVKDQRARIILQMAFASLDLDKVKLAQRELDALPEDSPLKSSLRLQEIPRQLAAAAPVVAALDLDTSPPLRILGLRSVHANMHFCAQALGHTVTAATLSTPGYDRLLAIYGISQFVQKRVTDLPEGEFQLITAGNLAYGSLADWQAFIAKLQQSLAEGGRIFLTLARRPLPDRNYDPDTVLTWFESAGAQVSRKDFSVVMNAGQATSFRLARQGLPAAANLPNVLTGEEIAEAAIADRAATLPELAPAAGAEPAARGGLSWKALAAVVIVVAAAAAAFVLYTGH